MVGHAVSKSYPEMICPNLPQKSSLYEFKWRWQGLLVLVACSVSLLLAARTHQLRCHERPLSLLVWPSPLWA